MRAALGGLFDSKLPPARRSVPTEAKTVSAGAGSPTVGEERVPKAEKGPNAAAKANANPEVQLPLPLVSEDTEMQDLPAELPARANGA